MIYSINDIAFADLGLIPGQQSDSNIAVSGNFDLPARIGKTHHVWEEGIEPYVSDGEIFFSGTDIRVHCLLQAADLHTAWADVKAAINGSGGLMPLATPYGTYQVYAQGQSSMTIIDDHFATVSLVFRKPLHQIDALALTPTVASDWMIDGLDYSVFNCFVLDHEPQVIRPAQIDFQSTVYGREAYKVNRPGIGTIELPLLMHTAIADFRANIDKLQYALMRPGIRKLTMDGKLYDVFCKDGFRVTDLWEQGSEMMGKVTIPFTYIVE